MASAFLPGNTAEERRRALILFTFFFLVIAAFWIQKPIRTSKFLTEVGLESLPLVRFAVAVALVPILWAYSAAVQFAWRLPRAALVAAIAGAFAAGMLYFSSTFRGDPSAELHSAYYFFVDVYSTVMVALFWSLAHSLSGPSQAKRTYAFVAAGGLLGGALGSALTGWSVKTLGAPVLLWVAAAAMVPLPFLALGLGDAKRQPPSAGPSPWAAALAGGRMTLGSRYLLAIAGLVFFYEVTSSVVDYQFNAVALKAFPREASLSAFLGKLNSGVIVGSIVFQALLTGRLMHRRGPRPGLLILPAALFAGSLAFVFVPVLAVGALLFFSDGSLHYSVDQTAKESLYTPARDGEKYHAKAFIDIFLFRLSKGVSALFIAGYNAWLAPAGWPVQALSVISILCLAAWIPTARWAGTRFKQLASPAG